MAWYRHKAESSTLAQVATVFYDPFIVGGIHTIKWPKCFPKNLRVNGLEASEDSAAWSVRQEDPVKSKRGNSGPQKLKWQRKVMNGIHVMGPQCVSM